MGASAREQRLDLLSEAPVRRQGSERPIGASGEADRAVLLPGHGYAANRLACLRAQPVKRQIQGVEPHARRHPADRRVVVRKLAVDGAVRWQFGVVVDTCAGDDAPGPIVAVAARWRDLDQKRRQTLRTDIDPEVEGAAAHSMRVLYR